MNRRSTRPGTGCLHAPSHFVAPLLSTGRETLSARVIHGSLHASKVLARLRTSAWKVAGAVLHRPTRHRWRRFPVNILGCAALLTLLTGCTGLAPEPVPEAINRPPAGDLQLVEAAQAPERHLGTRVRWGGTIIGVAHDGDGNARVEVLERRLDDDGRPLPGSPSDGRFIILAAPSVEPDLYMRGGEITVAGVLDAVVDGLVGEAPARLPVVRVEQFVRWEPRWRDHPYYHDPWYGPRIRFGVGIGNGFHHPGYWRHPHPYGW